MKFRNSYEDLKRAESYARLEFHNTYYLAFRDIPKIVKKNISENKALDFGCGTGRSTRFLSKLGFDTIGIDISKEMIEIAGKIKSDCKYYLISDDNFSTLNKYSFDLIFSAFTFDNIPTEEQKIKIFQNLRNLLTGKGKIISIVSSPEIYINEWLSFSTKDFPENNSKKCGEKVKIIIKDTDDKRPVEDIICPDEKYREIYLKSELRLISILKPLATGNEPYNWVNETKIAPWVIYILEKES